MVKNILLAMDDSPHSWAARQYAVELARAYGSLIKTLTVGDIGFTATRAGWEFDRTGSTRSNPSRSRTATATKSLEQTCLDLLNEARARFEEEGVSYRTLWRLGVPTEVIVEEADTADLVVMGHQGGRTSFLGVTIGSTASGVARRVSKPVFITPREHHPLERVLLAYDGSRYANHAMQWAADLATTFQLPIVVLSVHKQIGDAEACAAKALDYLRAYPVRVHAALQHGRVAEEILRVASQRGCNLIAMGAYGHSPLREALLGSTTEEVMNQASVPLLLVK